MPTPIVFRCAPLALLIFASSCVSEGDAPVAKDTQALSAQPTVEQSVRALTARGEGTVERSTTPSGATITTVREGNAEVLLARKNSDGTVSTRCISSSTEAEAFLNAAPVAKKAANQ